MKGEELIISTGCLEIGYGEGISQDEIDLGIFVGFGEV